LKLAEYQICPVLTVGGCVLPGFIVES
jgi:hypothetical protein